MVTFTQYACGTKSTTTEMSCKKETSVTGDETTCYCNTSKCNNAVDRVVVNKATILVITILAEGSFSDHIETHILFIGPVGNYTISRIQLATNLVLGGTTPKGINSFSGKATC